MKTSGLIIVLLLLISLTFGALAQDDNQARRITTDNASQLTLQAMLGRGWINQLTWSPDGNVLAVATSTGVWLHDANDLDAIPRYLTTHADTWSMAFSPDGRWLATGGRDMSVRVWDVATVLENTSAAEPVHEMSCRLGEWWKAVESLAFNPSGTKLACATDGVILWDVATGEQLAEFSGETDFWGDTHVAFSPDSATLATTGSNGKTTQQPGLVRQWDAETYELRASWNLSNGPAKGNYIAYSPDGALLAIAERSVQIRDALTGDVLYRLENTMSTRSLAFSPDGAVLVTASENLTVWNTMTGEQLMWLDPGRDEFAHCFGEETDQPWKPCPVSYHFLSVAFSPDGTQLAAADAAGRITLWTLPSGEYAGTLRGYNFGGEARGGGSSDTIDKREFAFSPDGSTLAVGASGYATSGGWAELWDPEKGSIQVFLPGAGSMNDLVYSPDGTLLVTASAFSGVRVWTTKTYAVRDVLLDLGDMVSKMVFSPNSALLAVGLTNGEIHLWDVAADEPFTVLQGVDEYTTSMAFGPNGILIATGTAEGTLQLWDVARGEIVNTLEGHDGWVSDVVFMPEPLPDGRHMLVSAGGYDDNIVRIWAVQPDGGNADELAVLTSAPVPVTSVTSAPDGSLLVSGHDDGAVRLWDVSTGDLLATLDGHAPQLPLNVAFNPDGTLLATGGGDGAIRLWGIP